MSIEQVVPGVYRVPISIVNTFLIEGDGELALVDTGTPGNEAKILGAVAELGSKPHDIRYILITHLHTDHTGSLAALKEATRAEVVMHPADAGAFGAGVTMRDVEPAPGLLNKLLFFATKLFSRSRDAEPVGVDFRAWDEAEIPFAGGIQVIHAPGHSEGHVAYLWPQQGGVLFAGDAASNMRSLGYPILFENREVGERSLSALAQLDFDVACFAHGSPIVGNASDRFREKWGPGQ